MRNTYPGLDEISECFKILYHMRVTSLEFAARKQNTAVEGFLMMHVTLGIPTFDTTMAMHLINRKAL